MIPTLVAVPVKNELPFTKMLLGQVLAEEVVDAVLVYDNGSDDGTSEYLEEAEATTGGRLLWSYRPEAGIYDLWNDAARWARERTAGAPVNLAILNNDLVLEPHTLEVLADYLRAGLPNRDVWAISPDPNAAVFGPLRPLEVRGTYRNQGLLGFAFMIAAEKWAPPWRPIPTPLVDPRFRWWYGDDDLAWRITANGGSIVRLRGLPIVHVDGGGKSSRHDPTIAQKIADDEALFDALWPGRR